MIQRKLSYKVEAQFHDITIQLLADSVTLPSQSAPKSQYVSSKFGHIPAVGMPVFDDLTLVLPLIANENPNPTRQFLDKLKEVSATENSPVQIDVAMIELINGVETTTYRVFGASCRLVSVKFDDLSTTAEETATVTVTLAPVKFAL